MRQTCLFKRKFFSGEGLCYTPPRIVQCPPHFVGTGDAPDRPRKSKRPVDSVSAVSYRNDCSMFARRGELKPAVCGADTSVKLALMSSSGKEMARGKTTVRRGQPNPLFKETFMFQVPQLQLSDVTLMVTVNAVRTLKREMIGWFCLGNDTSPPCFIVGSRVISSDTGPFLYVRTFRFAFLNSRRDQSDRSDFALTKTCDETGRHATPICLLFLHG